MKKTIDFYSDPHKGPGRITGYSTGLQQAPYNMVRRQIEHCTRGSTTFADLAGGLTSAIQSLIPFGFTATNLEVTLDEKQGPKFRISLDYEES
jgi:hypothetical protein